MMIKSTATIIISIKKIDNKNKNKNEDDDNKNEQIINIIKFRDNYIILFYRIFSLFSFEIFLQIFLTFTAFC